MSPARRRSLLALAAALACLLGTGVGYAAAAAAGAELAPAVSVTATATPTALDSMRADPTTVTFGRYTMLSARLASGATTLTSDLTTAAVTVWRRTFSSTTYTSDGAAVFDFVTGTFRASRRIDMNSYVKFSFAGDSVYGTSTSDPWPVYVRAYLPAPKVAPSLVRPGRPITISGVVKPGQVARTYLETQRLVAGTWRHFKTYSAPNRLVSPLYSTYRTVIRVRVRGAFRVRARVSGELVATTVSGYRNFSVR